MILSHNRGIFQLLFFMVMYMTCGRGNLFGQVLNKINCLVPYEINFSDKVSSFVETTTITYEHHDEHTFWYKMNFIGNARFSYEISSLDDQDNFDIYFYQYNGTNFCRSFIQENLELISFEKKLEYKVQKGSSYFLGVYPLFPGGCGHQISFKTEEIIKVLNAKNLHNQCEEDGIVYNSETVDNPDFIFISGKVLDDGTGNSINARITLADPFTGHQIILISNDGEGFSAKLLNDGDYKVKVQAFGYNDDLTAISAYQGESYTFRLSASNQKNYVLNNVYFYPNTFALKEESVEELESIYSFIFNHPGVQIEILGHTNGDKDVRPSRMVREKGEEWNFNGSAEELSLKRATMIKNYLIDKGLDGLLIKAVGKGGTQMIVKNPTNMKEAMQNIRVEIKINHHN